MTQPDENPAAAAVHADAQPDRGESYHAGQTPDGVCIAESIDDVAAIVKFCARHETPLIPFGAAS